ncbi:helix-turn-helix domain-containing protein [Nocardioides alcanivorans]|uniref:helix-turn-helix domain-containing protein n=1 Tax=Nocardioides alcanivorans TaxID=2897352 RepID=UPI001F39D505|nr:helix-turn-helix domain-containing protein [Nocardioides alcanivorans]
MTKTWTVAVLFAQPVLADARLIAGAAGLGRPVRDVSWYEGGDLTDVSEHLIVCDRSTVTPAYRLEALVRRAKSREAAGIVVHDSDSEPLPSTVRIADRVGLPVLATSTDNLVDLLHRVALIVRAPELDRARTIQVLIQKLNARGRTLNAVLQTYSDVLAQPIAILASDGTRLEGSDLALPADARLDLDVPQQVRGDGEAVTVLQPVVLVDRAETIAWLITASDTQSDFSVETMAIALAVLEPVVRAWIAERRLGAERTSRFEGHVLAELLVSGPPARETVQRAVALGWRLQGWHCGVHFGVRERVHQDEILYRLEQLRPILNGGGITGPLIARPDGWTAWVTTQHEPAPQRNRDFVERLRALVAQMPGTWGVYAGVGRPHSGATGIGLTLAEARDGAALARSGPQASSVEHIDELGVSQLLVGLSESDAARTFADSILEPLRDVEGGVLLDTLRVFMASNMSLSATANALGMHRNTVAARVARLKTLLSVDLDDPDQRLALHLACRMEAGGERV